MIEVDTTKANQVLADLHDALVADGRQGDASNIVADESRRLAVQIAKITPPQSKDIGEKAIESELRSLFSEADEGLIDVVGSEHGITNIDTFIADKSGKPLRLQWSLLDPSGDRMRERHLKALNRRGKVPLWGKSPQGTWRARVVVPKGTLAPYIDKVKQRVGRWKASWAQVAADLGVTRIGSWVRRHMPERDGISEIGGLQNGQFPSVTFGSKAPASSRQVGIVRDAVRQRTGAMQRRIRLIVSGYNKDLARGMRIRAKESRASSGNLGIG